MESAGYTERLDHEFARRFLQTAVVVDDEAYMAKDRSMGPSGEVVAPNRRTVASTHEDQKQVGRGAEHSLDARSVIDSFSALGMICGVVGPTETAMKVMRQADIVVLDWLLKDGDSKYALSLLRDLVAGDMERNALRLVAVYTGEARLEDVGASVVTVLRDTRLEPVKNESGTTITYRHGRVVIYAKSNVNLAAPIVERSVAEEDLPGRLVADFSAMTEGLLPSIALASLTAVREGAHMVLDQFCADLDPAFLAHRACISNPDDAERQFVNHVAEELRGLMDNALAAETPAGAEAVEGWIRRKGGRGATHFVFGGRELDLEQTVTLAKEGLEASVLKNNAFEGLSAGFAGGDVVDLDERLAWIMSFRTVFSAPPPTLWLGSVVTVTMDGDDMHLICMRPRCDCVRLKEETSFIFLPLVESRSEREQLVVRLGDEFKRLGIGLDPGGWVRRQFKPSEDKRAVTAARREPDGDFEFTDTCDRRYTWQGELKAEYAQRTAQTFATTLSRVAVDESEWLRRMAGKGH